jgi:hypothetical protein
MNPGNVMNRNSIALPVVFAAALAVLGTGCSSGGTEAGPSPRASVSSSPPASPAPSDSPAASATASPDQSTAPASAPPPGAGGSAGATPAGYKPCYLQPGYQKFAHLEAASTTKSGTVSVTLTFETCLYNTASDEDVRYTPTGAATTLEFAPHASLRVIDDMAAQKALPVSELPTWKDRNSGHFYIRLDSKGLVAAAAEVFHP